MHRRLTIVVSLVCGLTSISLQFLQLLVNVDFQQRVGLRHSNCVRLRPRRKAGGEHKSETCFYIQ